jgi:hypothetical protein
VPPNYYDVGDIIRTSSTFTDTGGTKTDPSTVHYVFTTPAGVDSVHTRVGATTGTVDTVVRGATAGTYFRDVTATSSGTYWYRFNSTGNITSAAEANFRVRNRHTDT